MTENRKNRKIEHRSQPDKALDDEICECRMVVVHLLQGIAFHKWTQNRGKSHLVRLYYPSTMFPWGMYRSIFVGGRIFKLPEAAVTNWLLGHRAFVTKTLVNAI